MKTQFGYELKAQIMSISSIHDNVAEYLWDQNDNFYYNTWQDEFANQVIGNQIVTLKRDF